MFNPGRLTLARLRAGFSKSELAARAGISARTVSNYEAGKQQPGDDVLADLARVLAFPVAFFVQDAAPQISLADREGISFRARSKITQAQQDTAVATTKLAGMMLAWLEQHLELPKIDLPDLSAHASDPETAAAIIRQAWGFGETPIPDLLTAVERHGVRVFSLAMDTLAVDAFSVWHEGVPMIFLNRKKTAERCRFDLAHELGHLLLHTNTPPQGREIEKEADAFAAALLLPRRAMLAERVGTGILPALLPVKQRWGVSAAALNYRLHKLGLVSEWMYRNNCIELAKIGRNCEPQSTLKFEESRLWRKAFAALQEAGYTRRQVADAMQLTLSRLNELSFGLQTVVNDNPAIATPQTAAPMLKILK